ncbi:MAG: hypothetical protein N2442_12430 [Spirochaetes bacterium]|nr:hypothetical protein [Spirochaetota bacterium]
MKIRTTLFVLSAAIGIWMVLLVVDQSLFPLFTSTKRTLASQAIWERVQALKSLQTVRYIQKVVFPYDYLDPELNFDVILTTLRRGKGSVNTLLSPRERDYLEARELAERVGLKFTGRRREFVVVTAQILVGFDLGTIKILPRSDTSILAILPPPKIVELAIEDPTPSTYPYPDVPLSPAHWKLVAGLVERKLRERPLDPSILASARAQIYRFLTSLFQPSGFTEIVVEGTLDQPEYKY